MMPTKWRSAKKRKYLEAQAMINEEMICLHAYDERLTEQSGIYILTRVGKPRQDGTIRKCVYVGQAKNMLQRLAQHVIGFKTIDLSIRHNHGLYDLENVDGWRITALYYPLEELNEREKEFIALYQNDPSFEVYNITSGGQDKGHTDINERKASKGYHDGLEQGYKNAIKDVREYFDKYLRFTATNKPDARKKDGQYKEIYVKKYNEFKGLLYGEEK